MLRDATLDLLLGSCCLGCERPGRLLCPACREALPDRPHMVATTEEGVSLVAAASYDGVVRDLVVGHKERGLHALARPLGELMAGAVTALGATSGRTASDLVLVPVPSRTASVRARGHDPTARLVRCATGVLAGPVTTSQLLRLRPGVVDQSGLDHAAREANLSGSMLVPGSALTTLARRRPRARAVICDDVHTTGATAREALRALDNVGVPVVGVAVVAATPLRRRRTAGDWSVPGR